MLRVFSYGGGVQSTAALVLAAEGVLHYPVFLFANTGDDSEHPATLAYVRDVALPYAAAHGIRLLTLRRYTRARVRETILERLEHDADPVIPVWFAGRAHGVRACTAAFKIRVVAKWLKKHGATRDAPALVGLGISLDEAHRARTASGIAYERLDYPLLALRMTRADCVRVIERAGLPVPPKSACWFCPFHSRAYWQEQRVDHPALFDRAVQLEVLLNTRRAAAGKDAVFLSPDLVPLDVLASGPVESGFGTCESGYCHT